MNYIAIQVTEGHGEEVIEIGPDLAALRAQVMSEIVALFIEETVPEDAQDKICNLISSGVDNRAAVRMIAGADFDHKLKEFMDNVWPSIKFERL